MAVGAIQVWALVYGLVVVGVWSVAPRSRAARLIALCGWSAVAFLGTGLYVADCVATGYEHVPGDPAYCSGGAASFAGIVYAALIVVFGLAAVAATVSGSRRRNHDLCEAGWPVASSSNE